MSVLTWPDFCVSSQNWRKAEQAAVFKSIFGSQSLTVALPLWQVDLIGVPTLWDETDRISLFLESLSGYTNQIALWNLTRPQPIGTMRGTMELSVDAAQGDIVMVIDGGITEAGKTLLAGDLIGIGSGITQQVVKVIADAVADGIGVINVSIGTPLRNDFTAGAVVEWNKPKALFRQTELNSGIQYNPKIGQPWSLSLLEDWRAS